MLASLDVLVLLKILAKREKPWTQPDLARELFMSQSRVNKALKTAEVLQLYSPSRKRVNGKKLVEALVHGARYFLAPVRGGEVRGMPTAWAGPPLSEIISSSELLPPVWPDSEGTSRGLLIEPLHPNVPKAAQEDMALYELLCLVDVLRIGGAREVKLAERALEERLKAI